MKNTYVLILVFIGTLLMANVYATDGQCGPAAKTYAYNQTVLVGAQCNGGTPTINITSILPNTTYQWRCIATNGGLNSTLCIANVNASPVLASCGPAAKIYTYLDASFNGAACSKGNANQSLIWPGLKSTNTTYSWKCVGDNVTVTCSAILLGLPTSGVCGNAATVFNASQSSYGSRTLCVNATAVPASVLFPANGQSISWKCPGENGGAQTTCYASRECSSLMDTACTNPPSGSVAFKTSPAFRYTCSGDCVGADAFALVGKTCVGPNNACAYPTSGIYDSSGACVNLTAGLFPRHYLTSCPSQPNRCGMVNIGTIGCDGSCGASRPLDSDCDTVCPSNFGVECLVGTNQTSAQWTGCENATYGNKLYSIRSTISQIQTVLNLSTTFILPDSSSTLIVLQYDYSLDRYVYVLDTPITASGHYAFNASSCDILPVCVGPNNNTYRLYESDEFYNIDMATNSQSCESQVRVCLSSNATVNQTNRATFTGNHTYSSCFYWSSSNWSTCGGLSCNTQTRTVTCHDASTQAIVNNSYCNAAFKPDMYQSCSQPCTASCGSAASNFSYDSCSIGMNLTTCFGFMCANGATPSNQLLYFTLGSTQTWDCIDNNGGTNITCQTIIDAQPFCGSANNYTFAFNETSFGSHEQCINATSSNSSFPLTGETQNYTCAAPNGGTNVNCSTSRDIQPICGNASMTYNYTDTTFGANAYCSGGVVDVVPSFPSPANYSTWRCVASASGTFSDLCVAQKRTHPLYGTSCVGDVNSCGQIALGYYDALGVCSGYSSIPSASCAVFCGLSAKEHNVSELFNQTQLCQSPFTADDFIPPINVYDYPTNGTSTSWDCYAAGHIYNGTCYAYREPLSCTYNGYAFNDAAQISGYTSVPAVCGDLCPSPVIATCESGSWKSGGVPFDPNLIVSQTCVELC